MQIAHVTATFPPYYAGTGLVCYYQAQGLARLGHSVTVFTAACASGDESSPEGVLVRRLSPLFCVGNAPFLPGFLGLRSFDIVHLHYPFIFGAEMVWLACSTRRVPYVLTRHNDLIGNGMRKHLFDAYMALMAPVVFAGACQWLVVSRDHAVSCRLASFFRRRWADVVEIPNGVDTDLFRPDVDGMPVRQHLGIPEPARVLLFVGALDRAHHFKGADYLLRAFARLQGPEVWLVLVGDGDLRPSLSALVAQLGIGERVRFVGTVPHRELPPFYAASDLVVLPSFPPESFGMVLIEAMACGRPVLAHDIPGVRTVVSTGKDGLLARPGDMDDLVEKMRALLDDPRRRSEMGGQGRAKVEERYAWPRIILRLLEVYEEVLR
ncbi:MAG: glycosyltransferase family 1 protein [Thermoflexia bacterium]|nr:MAG: glycosyltransferase family 1 protein [Thermoflexia bacterium]